MVITKQALQAMLGAGTGKIVRIKEFLHGEYRLQELLVERPSGEQLMMVGFTPYSNVQEGQPNVLCCESIKYTVPPEEVNAKVVRETATESLMKIVEDMKTKV